VRYANKMGEGANDGWRGVGLKDRFNGENTDGKRWGNIRSPGFWNLTSMQWVSSRVRWDTSASITRMKVKLALSQFFLAHNQVSPLRGFIRPALRQTGLKPTRSLNPCSILASPVDERIHCWRV